MNALNYETVVKRYAHQYLSLLAWGGAIPKAEFHFERYKGQRCKGWANSVRGTVVVRCSGSLADDLKTVLHELAHLAAPTSEHHGLAWKNVYARAAAEAFEMDIDDFDLDVDKYAMDNQVKEAAEIYLAAQGG